MKRTNTKLPITKEQLKAYADKYECTERCIREYIKLGLDLDNPDAIADHRSKQGNNVPNPLRQQKLKAETAKLEEQAKLAKIRRMEAERNLVNINDVMEAQRRLAAVLTAKLGTLNNDLPPLLEGLTAKQMIPIINDKIKTILFDLSEYNYNEEEQGKAE